MFTEEVPAYAKPLRDDSAPTPRHLGASQIHFLPTLRVHHVHVRVDSVSSVPTLASRVICRVGTRCDACFEMEEQPDGARSAPESVKSLVGLQAPAAPGSAVARNAHHVSVFRADHPWRDRRSRCSLRRSGTSGNMTLTQTVASRRRAAYLHHCTDEWWSPHTQFGISLAECARATAQLPRTLTNVPVAVPSAH